MIKYIKRYTRKFIREHPNDIFVFGDNVSRIGFGGQAKEARGELNTIGIPTKWYPNNSTNSYFSDKDFYDDSGLKDLIDLDFSHIKLNLLAGSDVYFPEDGIGTGLAQLNSRAPKIFAYIQNRIKELEGEFNGKI